MERVEHFEGIRTEHKIKSAQKLIKETQSLFHPKINNYKLKTPEREKRNKKPVFQRLSETK